MGGRADGYEVLFDSRLVEECVLLAESRENDRRRLRFRKERDLLYERGDPEEREKRFERFHRDWFERMELAEPLMRALERCRSLKTSTRRCIVMPAARSGDAGADLRDERPLAGSDDDDVRAARPTVILQLPPEVFVESGTLEPLLDRELLHVEDMLDPSFGYRPKLPAAGSPARQRRATERYRVLWDCTIDGRLDRRGRLGHGVAERRRGEFGAAFPEIGAAADEAFERWFTGPRPTHDEMLAAACAGGADSSSGICPLCSFAYATLLHPEELSEGLRGAIQQDFPSWQPADGLCRQCLDLYGPAGA